MSTTPRSDNAKEQYLTGKMGIYGVLDETRRLETELAAAKKRIADCEFVMAHRYDIIERQEPRCNEANARAEKAEADTARLDWLEANPEAIRAYSIHKSTFGRKVWWETGFGNYHTAREAIDKAMKEASK
jgi:hypothetical protein